MEPDGTIPSGHAPATATGGFAAGQVVGGGRFQLISQLGRGGMGVVWLARDLRLDENLALKFLPPEIGHDAAALDDMRRETLKSRKLTHPNIIRIHDFHEFPGELPFISMEYVDGRDLNSLRVEREGRVFTWDEIAPLAGQLCSALEYAHHERVVHRDLKPGNMMIDGRGRLKLADFGIAATISDTVSRTSLRSPNSGTMAYMSPQQMDGELPKAADDLYALGATLYELLTGQPPFHSGDIAHQVRNLPAKPIAQRLAELGFQNEIPPPVATLVMACLAKDPAQRPSGARAGAEWVGLKPISTGTEAAGVDFSGGSSRRPWALLGAAAAVMVLLGVGAWWFVNRGAETAGGKGGVTNRVATAASKQTFAPGDTATPAKLFPTDFIPMFDGRTLAGWDGDPRYWSVKDGMIVGDLPAGMKPADENFLIWRGGTLADFELRLAVRLLRGKSGIYYRAVSKGAWKVGGYEFNVFYPRTGGLAVVGAETKGRDLRRFETEDYRREVEPHLNKTGWNDIVIIARGNHFQHLINGHVVVDVQDTDPRARTGGLLAFQLTQGRNATATKTLFKDIRLRRLEPGGATPK